MQKLTILFHPQEAKTLAPGKVIAKKIPKPLDKAPEPVSVPVPEPEPEHEPVKEEKLSPEPILVNLLCFPPGLVVSFPSFYNTWNQNLNK